MGLTWTPWAVPALLNLALAWGAAVALLRTANGRAINRRLAAVLCLEGLWAGSAVFFMVDDPGVFLALASVGVGAMAAVPFQYLSFLGVALYVPIVAPFRSRGAAILLAVGSAVAFCAVVLGPELFIGELYSPPWATWNFLFAPLGTLTGQVYALASLFGLVASVWAYLGSRPHSAARTKAKWFAIAFGVRDLFFAITYMLYPVIRPIEFWGDFVYNAGTSSVGVIYVALLAYAVLRIQLFDIDLKLKFALEKSTIGALIAAGFFVGSEILERLLPVEGAILGLLVAGGVVLLLRPVQHFAEGLADRLMPGVQDTPGYIDLRKGEVYRAALEGAVEDGVMTRRERAMLDRLRVQLGIGPDEALRMEQEMRAAAA